MLSLLHAMPKIYTHLRQDMNLQIKPLNTNCLTLQNCLYKRYSRITFRKTILLTVYVGLPITITIFSYKNIKTHVQYLIVSCVSQIFKIIKLFTYMDRCKHILLIHVFRNYHFFLLIYIQACYYVYFRYSFTCLR